MREDYMGAMIERDPTLTKISEELDELHDEVLASLDDEQKPKEPLEE